MDRLQNDIWPRHFPGMMNVYTIDTICIRVLIVEAASQDMDVLALDHKLTRPLSVILPLDFIPWVFQQLCNFSSIILYWPAHILFPDLLLLLHGCPGSRQHHMVQIATCMNLNWVCYSDLVISWTTSLEKCQVPQFITAFEIPHGWRKESSLKHDPVTDNVCCFAFTSGAEYRIIIHRQSKLRT